MPQKILPELSFSFNGIPIKNVKEFNFLGLIIDSNLIWEAHLNVIGAKIAYITVLLRKLKYIFPKHILHSIYNSLIMCIHYRCFKYIILALDCSYPLHPQNWYSVNESIILTNLNEQNVKHFYVIKITLV